MNEVDATTIVIEAAERTVAARTARLALRRPSADTLMHLLGHGKLGCHPATPVFWLMKVASKHAPEVLAHAGWVDFVGRRYELDGSGEWMVRVDGGRRFTGRDASRLRQERRVRSSSTLLEPLWLIELLRGTVEAADMGEGPVRDVVCRHYEVVTDFPRAAAASQCGMVQHFVPPGTLAKAPAIEAWDRPHIRADVLIDDAGLVRRIHVRGPLMNVTIELFDFGAIVD
jgi:hypothetical protein